MAFRRKAAGYCGCVVFALLLSGVLHAGSGAAELHPTDPEVIHLFPLGGQPGSSVEIEILGRNLEGPMPSGRTPTPSSVGWSGWSRGRPG